MRWMPPHRRLHSTGPPRGRRVHQLARCVVETCRSRRRSRRRASTYCCSTRTACLWCWSRRRASCCSSATLRAACWACTPTPSSGTRHGPAGPAGDSPPGPDTALPATFLVVAGPTSSRRTAPRPPRCSLQRWRQSPTRRLLSRTCACLRARLRPVTDPRTILSTAAGPSWRRSCLAMCVTASCRVRSPTRIALASRVAGPKSCTNLHPSH